MMIDLARGWGVVGAGGAGFPTYRKLERPAETVILNAAECEPLIHKDKEILRHCGPEVLEGLARVCEQVGAHRCVLAIKHKYTDLIEELSGPAAERGFEVHELGDYYPAGDEFLTVHEVTGRVVPPGGLPIDVGCLVVNVESVLNLALARPVTRKYLTVGGEVPAPVTVRAPIGLSFRDLLSSIGAPTAPIGGILVGGVMMGRLVEDLDEVVTRTTGAVLCFADDHPLLRRYRTEAPERDRIGRSACDQCSFCTELCPRYLLGHPIEPHRTMRGLEFHMAGGSMVEGSQFCCECNLCSLYACPEDLFPKDACADVKRDMREHGRRHPATGSTEVRPHSMQEYRHIPVSSLVRKLGLDRFQNVGPLTEPEWSFERVRVPLGSAIGAPAVATVEVGAKVTEGEEIGRAGEGLGVPAHASVAGVVESVTDEIVIRRNGG